MGNVCQKSYEFVNSFGENARFVKCPQCKIKVLRRNKTKAYIKLNGCITCSFKNKERNKEKNKDIYFRPITKCRGRYDDEFETIDLLDEKPKSNYFYKMSNYKLVT